MAHVHSIYDTDKHFIIDPLTRDISTESSKLILMQNDHNSERYTFEIPRYIEGHDMSLCNEIQIHYDNISKDKSEKNSDFYTVTDMQLSPDDESIVIFSWLISDSATKIVGKLNFSIHFACVSEEGIREYSWHTARFEKVTVGNGLHNTESVVTEHSDFVTRMEALADETFKRMINYDKAIGGISDILDDLNGEVI